MKHTYKFFAVLLLSVTADVTLSATCTPVSGCRATMEDGTNADFCFIFQSRAYLETRADESTYRYNGLHGVQCDADYPDMAICQFYDAGTLPIGVGKYTPGNLACDMVSNTGGTLVFNMQYLNGEGSQSSTVTVHYQGGGETFESFSHISQHSFNLVVSGTAGSGEVGVEVGVDPGVVGIVLIILFLLAVATYVVVGVLVKKYWKGAEGVELIPNYHFWKDFPFLVKDGVIFTFTAWPCCKHTGFTRNYTKI